MYTKELPENPLTTTIVEIKYDCCNKEHKLKWKDADKNFTKHEGKHICRPCWLKSDKNPAKNKEVQEKIKKTNLEKYGTELPLNSQENIDKRKQLFEYPEAVAAVVEKRKATNVVKYGCEFAQQTEEVKQKIKNTNLEKYGTEHPLQNEEVKERQRQTCQERYGVDSTVELPHIRKRLVEGVLERYGVEYYNQLPEMKEYLRENCREWLKESWENPWAKGITRPDEWNEKQSNTMAEKIINGEFNPEDSRFYVTGYYFSKKCKKERAFFRSSLELKMHYILDQDERIVEYENEPFAIPYEKSEGIKRNYIPDFFAIRDNDKPILIEIKPAFRMREETVSLKAEIAEKYCKEHNIEFKVIDEKYLKDNCIPLSDLIKLPNVEIKQNKK